MKGSIFASKDSKGSLWSFSLASQSKSHPPSVDAAATNGVQMHSPQNPVAFVFHRDAFFEIAAKILAAKAAEAKNAHAGPQLGGSASAGHPGPEVPGVTLSGTESAGFA